MTVEIKPQKITVSANPATAAVSVGTPVARSYVNAEPYEGSYEITPTTEAQTFETKNKRMTDDLVVNPIPSNYGLITWSGSILTVS